MLYSATLSILRLVMSKIAQYRTSFIVFLASFLILFTLSASAEDYKLGALTIEQPWSRATPVGAKVAGGYMIIHNHGKTDDRLISFTTEIAGKHEIHEMTIQDNVMQMRQLAQGIVIPAEGEITLKPGSYHLMFIDLKKAITAGETFKATLVFEKAGRIDVLFAIQAMGQTKPHSDNAAGHGAHKSH